MTRYKIIVNPVAGNGAGARAIPRIDRLMSDLGLYYEIARSEQPWHAVDLTEKAVESGFDVIVAVGGDGTANEVINGLMAARSKGSQTSAMSVLSAGRGNDFANTVGIPRDLKRACSALAADRRRRIDIGRVTGGLHPQGRFFGNCLGVGFDAIGTIEAAKLPRLGGFLSYFVAVLKTIFLYYRAPLTTIKYDDLVLTQPSLMISVMNGRRLGGGFLMAPDAEPDDGLFDLCIAREVSRLHIFRLIPHFIRGTQASQDPIITGRAQRVSITAVEGTLPAQVDGEIICVDGRHLDVELLPRQLEIVTQDTGGDR